mmetsp:Transcript_72660/g.205996  ORF Transcript_72660/g.205996 Transcript_72660/m.205996 type:complete len:83 (-) Transcript_72660:424-672(-)
MPCFLRELEEGQQVWRGQRGPEGLAQMIFLDRKNLLKYNICHPPTAIMSATLKTQKQITRNAVESLVFLIRSSRLRIYNTFL